MEQIAEFIVALASFVIELFAALAAIGFSAAIALVCLGETPPCILCRHSCRGGTCGLSRNDKRKTRGTYMCRYERR